MAYCKVPEEKVHRENSGACAHVIVAVPVEEFGWQPGSVGGEIVYWVAGAAKAFAPVVVNSKRRIQSLVVSFGANFHCCAAC